MTRLPEKEVREAISDSISDGVFTVDEDWRITTFNRAAEEITGVPAEEAVGRPCCDVFRSSICESDCALKETLRTGRLIINKAVYIIDAHDRRVPISISTGILRDARGNVIGGVETFRDLSLVEELRKELHSRHSFVDIIGRSNAMRQLFDILPQVAESDSSVLIEGASGTGKELFAKAIHELSFRRDRRFVAVNCGALPDNLLESELFGYKAGAFTDARQDKPGRFAVAHGGTILLDEIGDMSPALQVRLLRALQEGTIEPLGAVEPVHVNVRVIAATNKRLDALVREGAFREDLYYRVNVVRLVLPALAERREDIPLLIGHFVAKYNRLRDKAVVGVSEDAMAVLMEHEFPGNVRELENIIEHAFVLCRGGLIEPRHLPAPLRGPAGAGTPTQWEGLTLEALEKIHIADALRRHHGNRKAAARELGINPSTLYRKMKSMDIDIPADTPRPRPEE
ncbi:MAG: sigma 54-interacting transcriptional regulator [Candidatus Hydrogenedentes bacterium]|nr:sigma 54-interacting transcriptional regulator [Candidatus Hydrogenedentota bacterium]